MKVRISKSLWKNAMVARASAEAAHRATSSGCALRYRRLERHGHIRWNGSYFTCQPFHLTYVNGEAARLLEFIEMVVSISFLLALASSTVMPILPVQRIPPTISKGKFFEVRTPAKIFCRLYCHMTSAGNFGAPRPQEIYRFLGIRSGARTPRYMSDNRSCC